MISQRYETASIANDFLIAIWFLIGSIFFLFPAMERPAAWLFVIGSFQFIVRPTIRLIRHIHLRHITESGWSG
ncbi:MAG: YrhK family protein [Terriglobales bacterium]